MLVDLEELANLPVSYAQNHLKWQLFETSDAANVKIHIEALQLLECSGIPKKARWQWDPWVRGLRRVLAMTKPENFTRLVNDTRRTRFDCELLQIIQEHLAATTRRAHESPADFKTTERFWRGIFLSPEDTFYQNCSASQLLTDAYPGRLLELRNVAKSGSCDELFPVFREYSKKLAYLACRFDRFRNPEIPMAMYFLAQNCFLVRSEALRKTHRQ